MKFTFKFGKDIDYGVVLFNLNTLHLVQGMRKRFKLREINVPTKLGKNETHIPELSKPLDFEFIEMLNTSEYNVPILIEGHEEVFGKFDTYFGKLVPVTETEAARAGKEWNSVSVQFVVVLNNLFEHVDAKVKEVTIFLTHYGHAGSYCYHKNTKTIAIYWNIGAPVITVAYLIIQALVHVYNYKRWLHREKSFVKTGLWHNKVAIATVLANLPMMTRIFGKKIESNWLYEEVRQDPQLLQKLRLETESTTIELANPIQINGVAIRGLTASEETLLRVLAQNKGRIVSTNVIAKNLWPEEANEKFSVYYFPKLVFTLRKKLALAGVNPDLVKSQSGRGYFVE